MTIKHFHRAFILALIVAFATGSLFMAKAQTNSLNIRVGHEQVQFTVKSNSQHIRVEVYSPGGELVFDSGDLSGDTIVWDLQDISGQPVADGTYFVTARFTADSREVKRVEQVIISRNKQKEQQQNIGPAADGNKVDGSGTPGKISKWTATSTIGDSLIIESENGIGIGASPTAALHVDETQPGSSGSNGTPAAPLLQLSGGKGGDTSGIAVLAGAGADVSLVAGNGGNAVAGSVNGKGGNILIQPGSPGAGAGAAGEQGKLLLAPLGGNVGIGTLSPGSKLTVFGRIEADNPGNGTGVLGQSDSGSGLRGVSTSGSAVLGTSDTGIGVRGISTSDVGVRGSSTSGIGVVGQSTSGLAGGFVGNVGITGSLGVGGASTSDGSTLAVAGEVHLTSGSFKFPDGSVQTAAGIAAVAHDMTLGGSGTTGSPLVVANLGIGSAQLANGAVSGAKIFVPLVLSGSNAGAILSVTNLGSGAAIQAAGAVDSSTGYSINGNRVLSVGGAGDLFVGTDAGSSNTTGGFNSFFGTGAGLHNSAGSSNSFFGVDAGWANTEGNYNSIFGKFAGVYNTTGNNNSFFGQAAGFSNTTGISNSFFGSGTGYSNMTGVSNSFFGEAAGHDNTIGGHNSFFGQLAGFSNTTGINNSFFGSGAGFSNTTANENSFFGQAAGFSNTTGVGNAFFGRSAGSSNTTGGVNSFFGQTAGFHNTTGSHNSFFGESAGGSNTTGDYNSFFGEIAGHDNTTGDHNSFFGKAAGYSNTTGVANSFFGEAAGNSNTIEDNNTFLGAYSSGAIGITNATAIGYRAQVVRSNSLVLGSIYGINSATADTNVGIGTYVPQKRLHVVGDVRIDGNLSKASGSFQIDHPLDPENKYLYHSFVESPDMMNIYNGNVTTDENGEAIIGLPEYFEALNRDFRYQLTVIGTFAQAIVADEIKGNHFTIRTSTPNVKVSWQVTGIRQDAYANKHRIPVEEEKTEQERGHYLHPEAFNQGKEKGIEWSHLPEMMQHMKDSHSTQIQESRQKAKQ